MLYTFIKNLISVGKIDGLSTKVDVFYAAGKLNDVEYTEIIGLLTT